MKTYAYKIYNNNSFLADLNNVVSDFTYSQDINSAGASLEITIGNKFDDVGAEQIDVFLVDEDGNKIVDEVGNHIVVRKTIDFTNIPIDLANRIKIYTFDSYYPNGLLVFDGLISKWHTSYKSDVITLSVLSYGVQLSNYFISAQSAINAIDQEVHDTEHLLYVDKGEVDQYAQSFTLGADYLIGSFDVYGYYHSATYFMPAYWVLYYGTPDSPGALIESGIIQPTTTPGFVNAQFSTPRTLIAGTYFIIMYSFFPGGDTSLPILESTSTAPLSGGSLFYRNVLATGVWTDLGEDLTFRLNISDGTQQLSFSNIDPGFIAQSFISQMIAQGAAARYTSSTIEVTGITANYDFKIASGFDGMNKALDLSPDGWYWYYDVATNYVHFHNKGQTADHILTLGKHFIDADIGYSLEAVKNLVYFSGGDTGGGENLYSIYSNPSSISNYGKWAELLSDNRVTLQDTADLIGSGELNRKQSPLFEITIEISADVYDIELFVIGQMVKFSNFNNLLDTVLFQIVRKSPNGNSIVLTLGNIPPRASHNLQEALARLDKLETINNTDIPT